MLPKQPRDLSSEEAKRFSDWDRRDATPEERELARKDLAVYKRFKIRE